MSSDAEASLGRLRRSGLPRVLFVSHSRGGGVARHIEDLASSLEGNVEVLLLQPHTGAFVELRWLRSGEQLRLWFSTVDAWDALLAWLVAVGIDRIHFHHVDGLPQSVLDLPALLGCPFDLTLHDYYPVCPAYHLADSSGRYCGMERECGKCLDASSAPWPLTIKQWRARFGALLASASRVIAPSDDAATRIRAFFPKVSPLVWPHPEHERGFPPRPLRVLIPGAISAVKGLDVLECCIADASRRGLRLHFVVLGFLGRPLPQWPQSPLTVTGEYPEGLLPELIAKEHGDVLFFPAQCPETFSYTLSAALKSGLPIVASDLGALGERLRGLPRMRIVSWNSPAAEMNDALASAAEISDPAPSAPGSRMTFDVYRVAYLAGLTVTRPAAPTATLEIDSRWLREPIRKPKHLPLAFLFQDGVDCGNATSLEQLRRYAFDPDSMYADSDARFRELIDALGEQRSESARSLAEKQTEAERAADIAKAAEKRLEQVEASSSWRLTAPLRRFMGWLRVRT